MLRHLEKLISTEDHHFRREDRSIHWQRIAAHMAAHPEDFSIPLANIERWLLKPSRMARRF